MSAESAIQPVYANHADQIEAALSALFCDVYDFLGRCPRLEMIMRLQRQTRGDALRCSADRRGADQSGRGARAPQTSEAGDDVFL